MKVKYPNGYVATVNDVVGKKLLAKKVVELVSNEEFRPRPRPTPVDTSAAAQIKSMDDNALWALAEKLGVKLDKSIGRAELEEFVLAAHEKRTPERAVQTPANQQGRRQFRTK